MKYLILLCGVLCGSLSGAFVRMSTAPSIVLVIYRMFFAVVLLTPMALRHRKDFRGMDKKTLLLCICSGVALGIHFAAYFEAAKNTTLAASAVLVHMETLFVALATVLFFRRRLPGKAWLAILLAFVGAIVIAMADTTGSGGPNALLGDIMAIIAAVLMAIYTMIGAVCRRSMTTTVYTYLVYSVAMVTDLLLTLVTGTPLLGHGAVNFGAALGMAVFCTLLGHSVFSWCLKYLPAPFVSMAKQLDPLCSSLWGLLLFSERPAALVFLGGAIIIVGVLLYIRTTVDEKKEE